MKEQIREFIKNELIALGDNIVISAQDNLINRKYNIFHNFSIDGTEIVKYMALGRSFDSQLGNRLQRIAMFIARKKFGVANVPNYIFLNSDKESKKVTVWTYSWDDDFDIRHNKSEINVYKTQCCYKANSKENCILKIIKDNEKMLKNKIKNKHNIKAFRKKASKEILKQEMEAYKKSLEASVKEYTFICDDEKVLNKVKKFPVDIPVDLIYFADDNTIVLYEIKAGGDLDSKNCEVNADEVLGNLELFSFVPKCYSYFATCYNNRGEVGADTYTTDDGVIYHGQRPVGGIFNICEKIDRKSGSKKWMNMRNRILVGSKFWEQLLPNGITYEMFIEIYQNEFKSSGLEQKLKYINYDTTI